MVPRVHVTFADVNSTYDELIDIFREDKFTRLPIFSKVFARALPSSARLRIRILLTVVIAVSADEKNAERKSNTSNIINCMTSLESNDMFTPSCD